MDIELQIELQKNKKIEPYIGRKFVDKINRIALDAGQKILDIYSQDFAVFEKTDQSPLTEADLASHGHILEQLTVLTPQVPILSEESTDISWQERRLWDCYWLVDPLDGTKEFIKRNGEFTVNIALIYQGLPVLGVVYAPVLGVLYFATAAIGAWKQFKSEPALVIKAVRAKSGSTNKNESHVMKVMGSRSHPSEQLNAYLEQLGRHQVEVMGSSLKICYLAEGKADLYPRLGPTCEWDTAAAHAVLKYAGGHCVNYETGEELVYNTKDSLLNPFFIAEVQR
ncbi:3'(2'),5'-bisphosphate nucleotidase CysQ [Kangiella sp. TOML190]|uniref:3'(2'),5'-bisphosphate nucleotidase CysQ n=1 Tax=Kangiella sp. TOML190 TaxID=2931351 RepID=UPI0020409836|nr:3'(2'),5'-bisphosphate nucleotidase CysQ [Kangiella sp. TOML190]